MTHNITREEYIRNPCGTCSTAYWKNLEICKPENIQIVHADNYVGDETNHRITKYFRIFHDLEKIYSPKLESKYEFRNVDIAYENCIVANIISRCYNIHMPLESIEKWTKYRVFNNECWKFIIDRDINLPVALGIADFDSDIFEGSLEWIQVLPEYRGRGLGQAIVNELLLSLKTKAEFVTVSGQTDNSTNPESLYRKCGFTGNDIWYVINTM